MKILIGTKNKGKVEAAQKAFSRFFETKLKIVLNMKNKDGI